MKSLEKQIEFVDIKLLPLFGISNIIDYKTIIYLGKLEKITGFINNFQKILTEFRKTFPVKNFNLHKTAYKIESVEHAFRILKTCLTLTLVQYECGLEKGDKYLRLIPVNNILEKYIEKTYKMSEKRTLEENVVLEQLMLSNNISKAMNDSLKKEKVIIDNNELKKNIKKTSEYEYYICPSTLTQKNKNNKKYLIVSDFTNCGLHDKFICSLTCEIKSIKKSGEFVITNECIDKYFSNDVEIYMPSTDNILCNRKFENGKEILYDDIILTKPIVKYNDLELLLEISDEIFVGMLLEFVVFKITVRYVEFYVDFDKKLYEQYIRQKIYDQNGNENYFITHSSTIQLAYPIFLDKTNAKWLEESQEAQKIMNKAKSDISKYGSEYIIGEFKGFKCNQNIKEVNPLIGLVTDQKYDFSIDIEKLSTDTENDYVTNYILNKKQTYEHICEIKFIRYGDAVNSLHIVVDDLMQYLFDKTYENLEIYLCDFGEEKYKEKLSLTKISNTEYKINEITDHNQILLINSPYFPRIIKIIWRNSEMINIFKKLKYKINYVFWSDRMRKDVLVNKPVEEMLLHID